MKPLIRHLATCAVLALASSAALAGSATVTFTHPENFRDMPDTDSDRNALLKELAGHFTKMAGRLPANQELKVEVTDIDLAGTVEPRLRHTRDWRVMRGRTDAPAMTFRFALMQDGAVLTSGEADLKDMTYLDHRNRYLESDRLRYEKQMLDDWFSKRLAVR